MIWGLSRLPIIVQLFWMVLVGLLSLCPERRSIGFSIGQVEFHRGLRTGTRHTEASTITQVEVPLLNLGAHPNALRLR